MATRTMIADENIADEELERIKRRKIRDWLKSAGGGEKLKERIVIPTEEDTGLNAKLSEHFGRAPYFTVVDLDENGNVVNVEAVSNTSEHFGGVGRPPDAILQLRPNALITCGMGPRALAIFQQAGVAVLKTNANTVKDVMEAYREDRLEELTEGCHHARHK